MQAQQNRRVFISYARKDGSQLAARLQRELTDAGIDAWLDTQRLHAGAIWTDSIEREIDTRHVTIALLTSGSYKSEICRAEQLRALRKGKRLIPVLAAKNADRPLYLESLQYRDFSDPVAYQAQFEELLGDIRGDVTAILPQVFRETRISYVTVPPIVANYLERPEALRALRDTLFSEEYQSPIALTALAGMGGLGKTVLAQALTRDEVVQQAFPDGIVWITLGREKHDFTQQMREIAKALGEDIGGCDNPLACQNHYRSMLAIKAALIVADDVWSTSDIDPLLAESPRSRFLLTTRDASIINFLGAREHKAELLDEAQSRELLAAWADWKVGPLPPEADEIVRECGRLPLALSQMGALLRGAEHKLWADTLDLLRNLDLSAIQEQLPPGQESFFRTVEVSFLALAPKMQERYKSLAVLLEDMPAPLPVLETLWNASESEALRTSKLLVDRSLAQRDDDGNSIRLHDLQLDYVQAQYADRKALDLIHGAVRLSSSVIRRDPAQFASQLVGRLLPHQDTPRIDRFINVLLEGAPRPWIRLLKPALHPPGTPLIRTLEGHSGSVLGVSGDGRLAVSASRDNTLKVRDMESGRELRTLQGHSFSVNAVCLSADGRLAISASTDKTLKVWDVKSGLELCTLLRHSDSVNGVAMSADGRLAVSASRDKTLKVWDVKSGLELCTLLGHSDSVNGVAMSADGRLAVSASTDKTLKVWDVKSGRELHTLHGHSTWVDNVAVSADGRLAISASRDKTLKVWDVKSGLELCTLLGHSRRVLAVALSANGWCAVSASLDGSLKVWDVERGRELRTLEGHSGAVVDVWLSADGRGAISASEDTTLKVWDVEGGHEFRTLQIHSPSIIGVEVTVSGDGRRALSASNDKMLKVWDAESGCELRTLQGSSVPVLGVAVAITRDGRRAFFTSVGGTLKMWDVKSGRRLRGRWTLFNSKGVAKLKKWSLENWRDLRWRRDLHTRMGIGFVAVTADGRRAISGSAGSAELTVWDVKRGRELRTLHGHSDSVRDLWLSADGRRALSASQDTTLKLWDVESGRELRTLRGHSGPVSRVAASADGRRALSTSYDTTLRVWDVESGRELRTLEGHSGTVVDVCLSADGRRALSASKDTTLRLWDVESGLLLATFSCEGPAHSCAFINHHKLFAGDDGGRVYFLSVEEPSGKAE
jgi:WD40 repeat protein